MNRHFGLVLLLPLAATATFSSASAANIWLSMNLEPTVPQDLSSGGTWTIVGKADERGIAGVSLYLTNVNLAGITYLAPAAFEVRQAADFGVNINIAVGDDLQPPRVLDIGVIGGSFVSSYVDPANLTALAPHSDLGSFTGGVALVSGTYNAGSIPSWYVGGPTITDGNVFSSPAGDNAIDANMAVTIRYAIPEVSSLGLAALSWLGIFCVRERRR